MSHQTSQVVDARAQYFASEEDLEIVACFLDFHDIRACPRKMQKPITDLLVSTHAPQSESEKAFSCRLEEAGKNSPFRGACLMYRNTLCIACNFRVVGLSKN